MKTVKEVKIVPSSMTEILCQEIKTARRRGKIYETRIVPAQMQPGLKYVIRTTSKDLHLGLGLLSEMAQLEMVWFLESESGRGSVDLRVDDGDGNFMFCTVTSDTDVFHFTITPAN